MAALLRAAPTPRSNAPSLTPRTNASSVASGSNASSGAPNAAVASWRAEPRAAAAAFAARANAAPRWSTPMLAHQSCLPRVWVRPFDQLVGGVGWLVRDGKPFVYDSMNYLEDMGAQETGKRFATIVSGRTALGHDKDGNIMIVQVRWGAVVYVLFTGHPEAYVQFDGQSWRSGIDLYSLATILVDLGVVNAINLDGGGSTTMTRNTTCVRGMACCAWLG